MNISLESVIKQNLYAGRKSDYFTIRKDFMDISIPILAKIALNVGGLVIILINLLYLPLHYYKIFTILRILMIYLIKQIKILVHLILMDVI